MVKYSIVIPVYNRPDEVDELMQSLTTQTFTDFEVIVVEDGSTVPCEEVIRKYTDRLDLKYFVKPNSGPGQSRNYGVEHSQGEYIIVLDSDVVLPPGYLQAVEDELSTVNCQLPTIKVIPQGQYIATSLEDYLRRHPEMDERLSRGGTCQYLTTESATKFRESASLFLNEEVDVQRITLN